MENRGHINGLEIGILGDAVFERLINGELKAEGIDINNIDLHIERLGDEIYLYFWFLRDDRMTMKMYNWNWIDGEIVVMADSLDNALKQVKRKNKYAYEQIKDNTPIVYAKPSVIFIYIDWDDTMTDRYKYIGWYKNAVNTRCILVYDRKLDIIVKFIYDTDL